MLGIQSSTGIGMSAEGLPEAPSETQPLPPPYERRFSCVERLFGVLFSPSAAMRDVALAPDYVGAIVIIVLRIVVTGVSLVLAFQKVSFVGGGPFMGLLWSVVYFGLGVGMVMFFVFWLLKSVLVKVLGDSGSGWEFGVAASVTGYAYMASLVVAVVSLPIVYWFTPSVTIDFSDLEAAQRVLADFQVQVARVSLFVAAPLTFLGELWKAYLGSLGTRFGTQLRCSALKGFAIFLLLGLIGWLVGNIQSAALV